MGSTAKTFQCMIIDNAMAWQVSLDNLTRILEKSNEIGEYIKAETCE